MSFKKSHILILSRSQIILVIYIFTALIILYRYFFLQIVDNEKYKIQAGNNSLRKIVLYPPRGIIYDRNFIPLVDNKPLYEIKIIPEDLDRTNFNYSLLYRHTGILKNSIDSVLHRSRKILGGQFKPMLLKRYIDFDTKAILEESKLDLKGLYFTELPARVYTSACNLSHTLGYLRQVDQYSIESYDYHSDDIIGFSGVEKFYEKKLKGIHGFDLFLVDRLGVIQSKYEPEENYSPIQGEDIVLSIDSKIQEFIEDLFINENGSIILMDPSNGEVISLLSSPYYNLDSFVGPIPINAWNQLVKDKNKPFTNRVTQQTYPPGSIFKLLLSAIALEKNIIPTDWKVECNGIYQFHDTAFRCWNAEGHGEIGLLDAIKSSCNIYFYNLMQKIDFSDWSHEVNKFGFGSMTGIDLPQEKTGLVPDKAYMNRAYKNSGGWSKGHLLNLSIGQGEVSVTPIQIIQLINLIVNDGQAFYPHVNLNQNTEKINIAYKADVWNFLKKSMYAAVNYNEGTAYNARISSDLGSVFGKTGTAQVCSNCDILPHGWFAGFIELKDGRTYSICILIENGGKGSDKPSKIASKIFNYISEMKDV
tara:strand:+ start:11938 stop:13704 length:1767 start_codon:yes stop_codon:yes gene_type:complete